jgi:alditol oxidase
VSFGVKNWAGNVTFSARRAHMPASVAELQELVAGSREIRALGTGHSFNTVADTGGDLVSVAGLPHRVEIDAADGSVTVSAGLRYGEFAADLHDAGLALHNLGSLPHISVAGACATSTHGSGVGNGSLATAVRALTYVAADGELKSIARGEPDFCGSVVALGALGIVTSMTLDAVPTFDVQQWVYEGLSHQMLREHFDEVMAAAYSVSLFTDWRSDRIGQVWIKHRVSTEEGPLTAPDRRWDAVLADGPRHPVPGISPEPCTRQLGIPGPWYARLPHFRLEFTPSSGDELQSEFFVARHDAIAAFDALDHVKHLIAPALQISEIRTIAADDLWLSPAHHRDSVAFHFTWISDTAAVIPAVEAVQKALSPFGARPHWGKVFSDTADTIADLYERYDDHRRLAARADPAGKFRNGFIESLFPGWE